MTATRFTTETYELLFNGVACANCLATPDLALAAEGNTGQPLHRQSLIPCHRCKRVWFCNEKCASEAKEHERFCSSIAAVPTKVGKDPSQEKGPKGWVAKCQIVSEATNWRCPCPEIAADAFLYGRHCIVCNRTAVDLKPCRVCLWDWSCPEHHDSAQRPHSLAHTKEMCHEYQVFNALALRKARTMAQQADRAAFLDSSDCALSALDVTSLRGWADFFRWRFGDARASEIDFLASTFDASRPLTVLQHLHKRGLWVQSATLLVHVVGAGSFDLNSQGAMWRLVLQHITPSVRLHLVFVGNELAGWMKPWPLSLDCTLSVDFANMLYEDYQKGRAEIPDLVVAFNAGVHNYKSWKPAINLLMELNVLVLVTCRTDEQSKELEALRSLGAYIQEEGTNPFMSRMPSIRPGRESLLEYDNHSYIVCTGRVTPLQIEAGQVDIARELDAIDVEIDRLRKRRRLLFDLVGGRPNTTSKSQSLGSRLAGIRAESDASIVADPGGPPPQKRTRTIWTLAEEAALRQGHSRFGTAWAQIQASAPILANKTTQQLKDKWHNIHALKK